LNGSGQLDQIRVQLGSESFVLAEPVRLSMDDLILLQQQVLMPQIPSRVLPTPIEELAPHSMGQVLPLQLLQEATQLLPLLSPLAIHRLLQSIQLLPIPQAPLLSLRRR